MTTPHTISATRRLLRFAAPLALLASLGCAKMSDSSYGYSTEVPMAMAEAQTVDVTGVDYESYDFDADGPVPDPSLMANGVALEESRDANLDWGPPARSKPGAPSVTETEEVEPGPEATPKTDDQTPDHGRQIIYVAGIQVSVYNLAEAMSAVEALPDKFGGWIHMRNQSQVVLRLPAAKLKPVMAEIAEFGVVEARTLQAQDVTAEYVDLDSRITVLRDTQTQLLDLLGKAKTVEEALHVRRALDDVTMELELALGRMRQLSDLITYSTLTVTLVERGPQDHIPTSNDPFGWVDSLGVEATEWR